MKRVLILFFLVVAMSSVSLQAQNRKIKSNGLSTSTYYYNSAAGLRAGATSGFTFKHFTSNNIAFEGILSVQQRGFSITGMREKYTRAFATPGLNWYYGLGGHIAVFKSGYYNNVLYGDPGKNVHTYSYYSNDGMGLGIDGIIGLEYKIKEAPVALSFDLKPFFEINTRGYALLSFDPGLGIKITF